MTSSPTDLTKLEAERSRVYGQPLAVDDSLVVVRASGKAREDTDDDVPVGQRVARGEAGIFVSKPLPGHSVQIGVDLCDFRSAGLVKT